MAFVTIDIRIGDIHYHLNLDRRVNFIRGDSGVGKSELVNSIELAKQDDFTFKLSIEGAVSDVEILSGSSTNFDFSKYKDALLILDEPLFTNTNAFTNAVRDFCISHNLVFLILSRFDVIEDLENTDYTKEQQEKLLRGKYAQSTSFSMSCIYALHSDNGEYWLEPYYKYDNWSSFDEFDLVIVEDYKAGRRFFSRLFNCEVSYTKEGKSQITNLVLKAYNEGHKKVLVLFDSAAFGCHIQDFHMSCIDLDMEVCIMSMLECFEEVLVRSNLIYPLLESPELLEVNANQYVSWENYFEDLLTRVSHKPFNYRHDKATLSWCYFEDCDKCSYHGKCEYEVTGDKFEYLLRGTKFECLLDVKLQSKE